MAIVGHSDAQDEPNTELGKQLKEHLDEILARIKDALGGYQNILHRILFKKNFTDHGKTVKEDTLVKREFSKQLIKNYLVYS